ASSPPMACTCTDVPIRYRYSRVTAPLCAARFVCTVVPTAQVSRRTRDQRAREEASGAGTGLLAAAAAALDAVAASRAFARLLPMCHVRDLASVSVEHHAGIGEPAPLPRLDCGAT